MSNIAKTGLKATLALAVGVNVASCVSTPDVPPVLIGDHVATFTCTQGNVAVGLYDRDDFERIAYETLRGGNDFGYQFSEFVENASRLTGIEALVQRFSGDNGSSITYDASAIPSYGEICPGWAP